MAGLEQCFNAQAVVAEGSLLVVATDVVQAANDKQQLQPMLNQVVALPDTLGKAETLLADDGYFSAANVAACEAAAVQPLIAMGREAHHPSLSERFADAPPPPTDPTPVEAMAYRLATPEGKKLYRLRKQMPEPVFGIISLCWTMSVSAAWARQGARRVEPCDHGLEPEADVHPLLRPVRRGEGFLRQNEGDRDRYRHSRAQQTPIGRRIDGSATGTLTPQPARKPESDRLLDSAAAGASETQADRASGPLLAPGFPGSQTGSRRRVHEPEATPKAAQNRLVRTPRPGPTPAPAPPPSIARPPSRRACSSGNNQTRHHTSGCPADSPEYRSAG